jgi:hypothetical protein
MIIYGTKGKLLAKETLFEKCTNCGSQNSVELVVYQRYAHVFWIPFFPTFKKGYSQCGHCKQVLEVKQMPASLQESFDRLKKSTKAPIWTFTGLALFTVLIAMIIISIRNENAENKKLVADPRKGDIYEVKLGSSSYTLYKVDEVVGDTVYVVQNMYETNKSSGLSDLKTKPFAEDEVIGYSKAEIKTLFDDDKIVDVDRKQP